jgi:hypothetical protein
MPILWAIGRRGWAPIRPTRSAFPPGQPGLSVRHEASSQRSAVTARTSLGALISQQPMAVHLESNGRRAAQEKLIKIQP